MRRIARRPALRRPTAGRHYATGDHRIGLRAARLVRDNWPAFWADHLAAAPATWETLLRAGVAAIRLAHAELELTDWYVDNAGELLGNGAPLDALRLDLDDLTQTGTGADAWELVEEFLATPPIAVYGLDGLDEAQEDGYDSLPPLAMALQWLTGLHWWPEDDAELVFPDEDRRITLAYECPRVRCNDGAGDRLARLCAALDASPEAGRWVGGPLGLGTVLAYAHRRTDNPIANIGSFEAYDAVAYGAWDFSWADGVQALAQQQRQARTIAEAYAGLERYVFRKGPHHALIDLAETIARVADHSGLAVDWPGANPDDDTDDTEVPDDDTDDTDHPSAAALAAA